VTVTVRQPAPVFLLIATLVLTPAAGRTTPITLRAGDGRSLEVMFVIQNDNFTPTLSSLVVLVDWLSTSDLNPTDGTSNERGKISLSRGDALLAASNQDGAANQDQIDNLVSGSLGAFADAAHASPFDVVMDIRTIIASADFYTFRFAVAAGSLSFDPASISISLEMLDGSYFEPATGMVVQERLLPLPEPGGATIFACAVAALALLHRSASAARRSWST
jgi:hypothetical protein